MLGSRAAVDTAGNGAAVVGRTAPAEGCAIAREWHVSCIPASIERKSAGLNAIALLVVRFPYRNDCATVTAGAAVAPQIQLFINGCGPAFAV